MRAVLCSALLVVFAVSLAVIASAQSPTAPAPQRKTDTGIELLRGARCQGGAHDVQADPLAQHGDERQDYFLLGQLHALPERC